MPPPAPIDPPLLESPAADRDSAPESRFSCLRGVRWRIYLGILPVAPPPAVDELRRVTADSRRRYASLRRRLLIDPHISKDGINSPDLIIDNPLSQNPDSTWGRYFRNAELEKMVDQDLSRLYPEHSSYFQTSACQAMLRRILLMWCLRHPEYGYRQGMHELLAPLLYVLQADVQHLSEVRKVHEDYFNDNFDEISFSNSDLGTNYRFTRAANWLAAVKNEYEDDDQGGKASPCSLEELDPETRDILMLSDPYGAEGELGIILSERFMEHDAYCMFDGLMSGGHGVVAMVEFFSSSPATGSSNSSIPVIEASTALYHLLSVVDSSLHSHLIELGVEPQYFALRWLRVLFGREFSLEDLLVIWDEIFSSTNGMVVETNSDYHFKVLCSPRGAFIAAMAVSMLLHLRSSLLATEYATSCLQRLLNFPENIDVKKLIKKAKSLQVIALEANISTSISESSDTSKAAVGTGFSLSSGSVSPNSPLSMLPDSYWEVKWRVMNKEEALQKPGKVNSFPKVLMEGKLVQKLGLSRTESDPSPAKTIDRKNDARLPVRRSLVDDFSREINTEADIRKAECGQEDKVSASKESVLFEGDERKHFSEEASEQNDLENSSDVIEGSCLSGENTVVSVATSHHTMHNDLENDSERSTVTSNSSIADNSEVNHLDESCSYSVEDNSLSRDSEDIEATSSTNKLGPDVDKAEKHATVLKERRPLSGRFQWFWKFGKGTGDGNPEKGGNEAQQSSIVGNICRNDSSSTTSDGHCKPYAVSGRTEGVDKKMMNNLKNLGQSMLENIQVIESVFQQDRSQTGTLENISNNILVGKGQATAMTAIKELRKISNLLSEM